MKNKGRSVKEEMGRVLNLMESVGPGTPEYTATVKNLETLSNIQTAKGPNWISREAILQAVVTVGGTLLILYFEKFDNVTSKAFQKVWNR